MTPVEISVVIPARNVESVIAAQLEALCEQDYGGAWELVVADNRSTDATVEVARSFATRLPLRVIDASRVAGVSYARNLALAETSGESIVFLDADDVADRRLLGVYARRLREEGFLGGRLDHAGLNDIVTRHGLDGPSDEGLPMAFGIVTFPIGANFAIRRSILETIGLFDESLGNGGEEVDLAVRAHLRGIRAVWVPEAIVSYRHRRTLRALARQQYSYGRGATQLFVRYRRELELRRSSVRQTARALARIVVGARDVLRGRTRRRLWVWQASALLGNVVESVRLGTWYLG